MEQAKVDDRLTDVCGVAERGAVSKRTIHRLNASGRMPRPVRIGGCLRWRASDIDAWISMGCPDRETFEAQRDLEAQGHMIPAVRAGRGLR